MKILQSGTRKFIAVCLFPLTIYGYPAVAELAGPGGIRELYNDAKETLEHPTEENPFYLSAENRHRVESGNAALYFPQGVNQIADALGSLSNWCEILPLHINVKACTFDQANNKLTVYLGRKYYQAPDDAYILSYEFKTIRKEGYFAAVAVAEEGPLGTSDYHIEFEVIQVDGKTFGRIHVSDHQSWMSSKALDIYLATKGKDKQGIKVVGQDEKGNPVYSTGTAAVAERNLLRYYFAFSAFFDSAGVSDPIERHEKQMHYWFDRTELYPQLHEVEKDDYFEEKRKERRNQDELQRAIH